MNIKNIQTQVYVFNVLGKTLATQRYVFLMYLEKLQQHKNRRVEEEREREAPKIQGGRYSGVYGIFT